MPRAAKCNLALAQQWLTSMCDYVQLKVFAPPSRQEIKRLDGSDVSNHSSTARLQDQIMLSS